jgi:phosphopantothenoylcysteine decarboxylase / phosphopantothenate---cysteine ligase
MANVVVGVTGGIAAYKSASLVRLLAEAGHSVKVIATANATRFIGETTLEALSHNKVQVVDPDLFTDVESVKHVTLAQQADIIVVAPATASFLAKVASGIADDLLTTTVLTATCPIVLAPAMHTEMWLNSATVQNVSTLRSRGINIVDPGVGRLTGQDSGVGRLAEPEEILGSVSALLGGNLLSGARVLVTTGGTREKIDPARFVGNFSSGKQGMAFARAARDMGANVFVIAANVSEQLLQGFDHVNVVSAEELERHLDESIGTFDLLVMAAAVADYRPAQIKADKIKRNETGETLELTLVATPDILAAVTSKSLSRGDKATIIGFAAETGEDLESLALKKLKSKGCSFIVANSIESGEVFDSEHNSVVLASEDGVKEFSGSKYEVARGVLEAVSSKVDRTPRGDNK